MNGSHGDSFSHRVERQLGNGLIHFLSENDLALSDKYIFLPLGTPQYVSIIALVALLLNQ